MTDETKGDGMTLSDKLDALVKQWWSEPDGMWAVNLSKRRCAEQLKEILDDPNHSIEIHLDAQSAMRVDEAMVERYAEAYWVITRRASWGSLAEITKEAQRRDIRTALKAALNETE